MQRFNNALLVWLHCCALLHAASGGKEDACKREFITLPDKVSGDNKIFLESNYGHWSSANLTFGDDDGIPKIHVESILKPYIRAIDDQDMWFWVHHRRYNLEYIEVHAPSHLTRTGGSDEAVLELRLIHRRSALWSHVFGDDSLYISILVNKAAKGDQSSSFLNWLLAIGPDRDGGYHSEPCADESVQGAPWADNLGTSCSEYSNSKLCTATGMIGENWTNGRPKLGGEIFPLSLFVHISEGQLYGFPHYAKHGYDAREACCNCGGGGFHGIWPDTNDVLQFQTHCSGKPTTWIVLNKSLQITDKHLRALKGAASRNQNENVDKVSKRSLESLETFLEKSPLEPKPVVKGKLLVNTERFVVGSGSLHSVSFTRLAVVMFIAGASISTVLVFVYLAVGRSKNGYMTLEPQNDAPCSGRFGLCGLVLAILLKWLAILGVPFYAYRSGLISPGAGFPWELHCLFLCLLCSLCVYQLRVVNLGSNATTYLACMLHGSLAIVASYLEASFAALIGAVLCPVKYANHEAPAGPHAMWFWSAVIAFVYVRVVFGLIAGVVGFVTHYLGGQPIKAFAILAFRNNLEMVGFNALQLQEAGSCAQIPACGSVWQLLGISWMGWFVCILAVISLSLTQYVFVHTSGRQLPIIWASIACSYAQHLVRASDILPTVKTSTKMEFSRGAPV